MSDNAQRLPHTEALALAAELVALLSPYCERLEILGSLRRKTPTAGDIELLAIPKMLDEPMLDLFGEVVQHRVSSLLEHQVEALLADGVLHKRPPTRWGDRFKAALYQGFPLDLFMTRDPANYGYQKVLRTGSAAFSKRLVTPVEKGGWLPAGLLCRDGYIWRTDGGTVATLEEEDVFALLGRDFVAPELRDI